MTVSPTTPLLKYSAESISGELRMIIKSSGKVLVDIKINGKKVSDTLSLNSQDGVAYKIDLIGKHARGSYDIECMTK